MDIFTLLFLEILFSIIMLMFITGLLGRVAAYITLKSIYNWRKLGGVPKKSKKKKKLSYDLKFKIFKI